MERGSSGMSQDSILSEGTYNAVVDGVGAGYLDQILKDDIFLQDHLEYNFLSQQTLEVEEPSPTSKVPCFDEYRGPYNFHCDVQSETSDQAKWLYSSSLNKLFVNMYTKIPMKFKWDWVENDLQIRSLLVFTSEEFHEDPVLRCPRHCLPQEESNAGFAFVDHVIRCEHGAAMYHKDFESERLSVVVPVCIPPTGTDWQTINYYFTCKNSCTIGMNRRSTAIIFTLERSSGQVIGRQVMKVRICSCPKRDKEKEESDQRRKSTESTSAPPSGKRLIEKRTLKYTRWSADGKTLFLTGRKTGAAFLARQAIGMIRWTAIRENRGLTEAEKKSVKEYTEIIEKYGPALTAGGSSGPGGPSTD